MARILCLSAQYIPYSAPLGVQYLVRFIAVHSLADEGYAFCVHHIELNVFVKGNIPPAAHSRGNESTVPEIPVSQAVNADQTGIVAS
ncbi:MAG: hypothetical protein VB144_07930 [Clostridia bacterium]|nr:hypothetical protein [Clostridia bacterium]